MKIRPVEAELLHADRRTDITKLIVAVNNFPNAPYSFHISHSLVGLAIKMDIVLYEV